MIYIQFISFFLIGVSVGVIIGCSINGRKIDSAIKEAKEQIEISKKLTAK